MFCPSQRRPWRKVGTSTTRAAPGLHESVFRGAGSAAVWVPRFMLVYHHKMLQVETFVGRIFIWTDRIVLKFLRAFKINFESPLGSNLAKRTKINSVLIFFLRSTSHTHRNGIFVWVSHSSLRQKFDSELLWSVPMIYNYLLTKFHVFQEFS
jgi:hypothetical protein